MDNLYISQALMNPSSTTMNVNMDIKGEPVVEQYKQQPLMAPAPIPTPAPIPAPAPAPQQDPHSIIQDLQQQLYESKQTQEEYKIRVQRLMELVEKQATIISTLQQQVSSQRQQ